MRQNNVLLIISLAASGLFSITGCYHLMTIGSYEKNVSHVCEEWGGFDPLVLYEIQKPLFLREKKDSMSTRIIAVEAYNKANYGLAFEIIG